MTYQILLGNNLDILPTLPDNSVDSIVTDPPYELGFMGKKWDSSGIAYSVELWQQCLRVLKPGGHLLSFGGTRTWHRVAVAIEDAGFEIRDSIAWLYGSGFPKSLDVSKAIDKNNGKITRLSDFTIWMRTTGLTVRQVTDALREANLISENGTMASHYFATSESSQPAIPTAAMWQVIRPMIAEVPNWVDEMVARIEAEREVIGQKTAGMGSGKTFGMLQSEGHNLAAEKEIDITAPSTPEAQQWQGWGTALKPAFEPIVVARKPIEGTVANNVLKWGTGGLNIDGSRIGTEAMGGYEVKSSMGRRTSDGGQHNDFVANASQGRWPANIILDPYTAEVLDEQSGTSKSPTGQITQGGKAGGGFDIGSSDGTRNTKFQGHGDTGGASRFFKVAVSEKPDTMNLCKNTTANNVANYLITIRATIGNTALTSAGTELEKRLAQAVKDAGIQCDSCGISIAQSLVELKTLALSESTPLQDFMHTYKSSTLIQNLALIVEQWVNTDTIPTTTSLSKLFGSVPPAIAEHIRPESLKLDSDQVRFLYQAKASKRDRNEGLDELEEKTGSYMTGRKEGSAGLVMTKADGTTFENPYAGKSGAAKNFHPTVKPTTLMEYLIKLVTPPGGVVLDPFTGSGSTGKAAILKGFDFIGIEMTEEYLPIIEGRLKHAEQLVAEAKEQEKLKENEVLF